MITNKKVLDCSTNFPCQHLEKRVKNNWGIQILMLGCKGLTQI